MKIPKQYRGMLRRNLRLDQAALEAKAEQLRVLAINGNFEAAVLATVCWKAAAEIRLKLLNNDYGV